MQKKPEMSAKIYSFPTDRILKPAGGPDARQPFSARPPATRANIVHGNAWYHDVAIKDHDPTRR